MAITIHNFGTLKVNGIVVPLPTYPWSSELTEINEMVGHVGNILSVDNLTSVEITDTTANSPSTTMRWNEVTLSGKTVLVADRNWFVGASWSTLNSLGLISGREVVIDGITYKLRVLDGGSEALTKTNEWDKIICNCLNEPELPYPTVTDNDKTLQSSDYAGAHNQLWNWLGVYSYCQETNASSTGDCVVRGNIRPSEWGATTNSMVGNMYGWRPVLELTQPILQIDGSSELGPISECPSIQYRVTASYNKAARINIYLDINNGTGGTCIATLSSTPPMTGNVKEALEDYWPSLTINTAHSISIVVTDSLDRTVTKHVNFTRLNNKPVISGTDTNIGAIKSKPEIVYTVSDADNDECTISERITDGTGGVITLRSFKAKAPCEQTVFFDDAWPTLSTGFHTLTITVEDKYGEVATRELIMQITNNAPSISTAVSSLIGAISVCPNITYTTNDIDGDVYTIVEKIGTETLRTLSGQQGTKLNTFGGTISTKWFEQLDMGTHTVHVQVVDSSGSANSYSWSFSKTNNPPFIETTIPNDLGNINQKPTITYNVNDLENDSFSIYEYIDDTGIPTRAEENLKGSQMLTFHIDWDSISMGPHILKVESIDSWGRNSTQTWTFNRVNNPPKISDSDRDLGIKYDIPVITYSVYDPDRDDFIVTEMVDNIEIASHQSTDASYNGTIDFSGVWEQLEVGIHSIVIYARDTNSTESAARTFTFTKYNNAPSINDVNRDLGELVTAPFIPYIITDAASDTYTVTELIDGTMKIRELTDQKGENTYTFDVAHWDTLSLGDHQYTIKAVDNSGNTSYRIYTFTKVTTLTYGKTAVTGLMTVMRPNRRIAPFLPKTITDLVFDPNSGKSVTELLDEAGANNPILLAHIRNMDIHTTREEKDQILKNKEDIYILSARIAYCEYLIKVYHQIEDDDDGTKYDLYEIYGFDVEGNARLIRGRFTPGRYYI